MTMKKQNLRYMKWIGKMIVLLFIFISVPLKWDELNN